MTLTAALLFGMAVFLVFTGLFSTPMTVATRVAADLEEIDFSPEAERKRRLNLFEEKSLLDRAFGPIVAGWAEKIASLLNRSDADRRRLEMADYPKPFYTLTDFYAYKILSAAFLAAVGIVIALVVSPSLFPVFMLALGALGFFLPDLNLNNAIKTRREKIIAELAFVPDRIAIQVQAGKALPLAIRAVAAKPGGPLVQELRKVMAEYEVSGNLAEGLTRMAERTGLPELRDFAGRVRLAMEQGTAIAPLLQVMGIAAREKLNLMLETRARRNELLLVIPVGALVLPAIMILLGAPGFYTFFFGGPF